eukprot:16411-Prymnesium_polylepis.1
MIVRQNVTFPQIPATLACGTSHPPRTCGSRGRGAQAPQCPDVPRRPLPSASPQRVMAGHAATRAPHSQCTRAACSAHTSSRGPGERPA